MKSVVVRVVVAGSDRLRLPCQRYEKYPGDFRWKCPVCKQGDARIAIAGAECTNRLCDGRVVDVMYSDQVAPPWAGPKAGELEEIAALADAVRKAQGESGLENWQREQNKFSEWQQKQNKKKVKRRVEDAEKKIREYLKLMYGSDSPLVPAGASEDNAGQRKLNVLPATKPRKIKLED